MVDGGGGEDVSPGFEGPVVVIGRDALEGEVTNSVSAEDGGEAAFSGGRVIGGGGGEREGVGEGLGQEREFKGGYAGKDLGLKSL